MKHAMKRLLAMVLVLSMLLPSTIISAHADENEQTTVSKAQAEQTNQEPERVFVELSEEPLIETATREGVKVPELSESVMRTRSMAIAAEQKEAIADIEERSINIEPIDEFSVTVNGFSAKMTKAEIEEVKKVQGVRAVYTINAYKVPEITPSMEHSAPIVHANETWEQLKFKGEGSVIGVIDTGVDVTHKDFKISDSTKAKLSEEKVNSIIYEYNKNHDRKMLGKYYNKKFPYVYDYQDNDQDTYENKDEQHGQHVTGTVAANGDVKNGGIKGIAPEAQILALKVFSNDQNFKSVFWDTYMRAIEDAIALGADGVNLSLGAPAGIHKRADLSLEEKTVKKAVDNGVAFIVAAGNDRNINEGVADMITENPDQALVGTPAILPDSLSVASYENNNMFTSTITLSDGKTDKNILANIHDASPVDKFPSKADVVYVGKGIVDPLKGINEYKDKNVKGKIALVERGTSSFTQKKNAALANGAIAIIIYNHADGGNQLMGMLIDPPHDIPMAFIGRDNGELIKNTPNAKISFDKDKSFQPNPKAKTMSVFSSWGPSSDLLMKPEITAPGGQIYSTQNKDKYTSMSGTSMATPHVAGGMALVRQYLRTKGIDGNRKAVELSKTLMMNTAVPIKHLVNGQQIYYSVMEQGAGMMNLKNAITTPVYVTATGTNDNSEDAKLELLDNLNGSFDVTLKLTNMSNADQRYSLSVDTLVQDSYIDGKFERYNELTKKVDSKIEGSKEVTVPANETAELTFKVTYTGVEKNRLVDGFIKLTSESGSTNLSVPFLGFHGDWAEPKVVDGFWQYGEDNYFGSTFVTPKNSPNPNNPSIKEPLPSNGKQVYYSLKTQIMPSIALLRNAEKIEFSIVDKSDKLIKNLTYLQNLNKIANIEQGRNPFYWNMETSFNGLSEKPITEGEPHYYKMAVYPNYGDTPQVIKKEIILDNTAPTADILNKDLANKKITAKFVDTVSGVRFIGIYNKTKDEIVDIDLWQKNAPRIANDGTFIFDLSKTKNTWEDNDEFILCAEDAVWNSVGYDKLPKNPNTGNPSNPQPEPYEPIVKDDSGIPRIVIKTPNYHNFVENETVQVTGIVGNVDKLDKVLIEQINPTTGEVLASSPNVEVTKNANNDFNFKGDIATKAGYIFIRVTAISGDKTENVTRMYWYDDEAPTLEVTQTGCENGKVKLKFHYTENSFFAVLEKEYQVGPDKYQRDEVDKVDNSYESLFWTPIDREVEKEFDIEDGENEFTFIVSDDSGNHTKAEVKVKYDKKAGTCANAEIKYETGVSTVKFEADDEVITAGEKIDITDNIKNLPQDANVTDITNPKIDNNAVGEHVALALVVLKDGTRRIVPVNVIIKAKAVEEKDLFNPAIVSEVIYKGGKIDLTNNILNLPKDASIKDITNPQIDTNSVGSHTGKVEITFGDGSTLIVDIPVIVKEYKLVPVEPVDPIKPETDKEEKALTELKGSDRYQTAVEISKKNFEKAETVVVASGESFPDALAATSLAGIKNAPLLLTEKGQLPEAVKAEIERLGAKNIILIGGLNTIDAKVEKAFEGKEVQRLAGLDRYQTAAKIVELLQKENPEVKTVILADGRNYPDALAIGAYAAKNKIGILLADGQALVKEVKDAVAKMDKVVIAGGEKSVPEKLEKEIKAMEKEVQRLAGADRYQTAAIMAEKLFPGAKKAVIASGEVYADALAGAVAAAKLDAPILLVRNNEISQEVKNLLKTYTLEEIVVLGGHKTITSKVREELKAFVK